MFNSKRSPPPWIRGSSSIPVLMMLIVVWKHIISAGRRGMEIRNYVLYRIMERVGFALTRAE